MAGRQPGAVAVVQRHAAGFISGQDAVDQHHAGDLFHQPGEFLIGDHFGVHHQRRAAMADQLLYRLALLLHVVVAIANQQKIAGAVGHLFDGFDHRAEEGVGDIAHHQADGFRGLLGQRPGVRVGVIVQGFHRRAHGLTRGFAGFGRVVDDAGDGSDGDSCESGYILNSRHTMPFLG